MTNPILASGTSFWKRIPWIFAGAALSIGMASSSPAPQSATQFKLAVDQQFTGGGRQLLSISPDGSQFVYVANNSLYIKTMSEKDARLVAGTTGQGNVTNPVFSPDGKFIAYWSGLDQSLKRVAVGGGTPQVICQAPNPYGMSWGADDEIVFGQGAGGIRRVRATGGTAETVVTVKSGEIAHGPQMLPGGSALLYTLASNADGQVGGGIPQELLSQLNNPQTASQVNPQVLAALIASLNASSMWDKARIVVTTLKSNETKVLLTGGSDARYSPTGHIVFANAGKLMSVRFDVARQEISGSPVMLMNGVRNAGTATGTSQFSFSNTGSLVYVSTAAEQAQAQREMSLVDLSGKMTLLRHVPSSIFGPRISPNGKQVAYRDGGAVWIADLTSEAPPRRLTTEPGEGPVWSPDGERIVYISIFNNMEALFWRRSDGTGAAERLVDRARAPESWSAVNQAISFITLVGPSGDAGDYDIWSYSLTEKKESPLIVVPNSAQSGSRFSPDGRWIAYESNESGRAEVFVESVPRTSQRFQISKTGGARPVWAPDMSKLYFDNNAGNAVRMLSVNVRTQPAFSASEPEALPITGFVQPSGTIRRQFDITADGRQFLMTFPTAAAAPQVEIISNWFEQLKAR